MIKRPRNTKEKGVVEFVIYKEGNSFVGVCLTFDILEEGDNPMELIKSLKEAAELHLETVRKNNMSDELLNRYAPEEYWAKYFDATRTLENPSLNNTDNFPILSPYQQSWTTELV